MKVFISVDMEGIAGVTGRDEITREGKDYERYRKLMTAEANQAIAGAFDAGATEVVVNDSHGGMRNLLYDELDPRAALTSGFNKPLAMMEGVAGAAAAVFIGYHARAGQFPAVMDHTISGAQVHNWWMNGVLVGEAQLNAALAAYFGVPVVLVSGDDCLAREIEDTLPGTRTVVVKDALGQFTATSRPRAAVHDALRTGVRAAVEARDTVPIRPVSGPVTFRLEFTRSAYAEVAALLPQVARIDGRTIEVTGTDLLEAWRMALAAERLGSTAIV
jgi:D-amino peptidase